VAGGGVAHVLSIAGSDPSGGAGIQADLKTFAAFGVYGMAAITSVTAQNTRGVTGVYDIPAAFVAAQIEAVCDDIRVDAAKTGMLRTIGIIEAVANALPRALDGQIVVDPVMVATSGDRLIDDDAMAALVRNLFPRAAVVTPNADEASAIAGRKVTDLDGARRAAEVMLLTGAAAVLVTGIASGGEMIDILCTPEGETVFGRARIDVGPTHGSGCTLSSAIAARLALGDDLADAVLCAKNFVWRAIRDAVPVGRGAVPLRHDSAMESEPREPSS